MAQYASFANANWKRLEDLAEWLKATYPPKCIVLGQTPEDAHRCAGQIELAQRLILTIEGEPIEEE